MCKLKIKIKKMSVWVDCISLLNFFMCIFSFSFMMNIEWLLKKIGLKIFYLKTDKITKILRSHDAKIPNNSVGNLLIFQG